MELNFADILSDWVPLCLTIPIVVAIYKAAKFFLDKQIKNQEGGTVLGSVILFLIILIGFIAIILSIPMDTNTKGQITSLIGIVIAAILSLGSATFFGNALAGVLLRAINNFKMGDFIKVGDIFGRVSERGLFHTEVQTEDRALITLPNLQLANNPVKVIRASGTFVSGLCSLGYDVHHSKVKEVLNKAAANAGLEDSFVLIKELGDFSIVYEVLGLLKEAKTVISAKSRLHSSMLDALHEANIEIVSPGFVNQRQVNEDLFIPAKMKPTTKDEPSNVENKIFDKAEQAESIHKSQETIVEVDERLKNLQLELKNAKEESTKANIQLKINKYQALMERMKTKVETKIGDLEQ